MSIAVLLLCIRAGEANIEALLTLTPPTRGELLGFFWKHGIVLHVKIIPFHDEGYKPPYCTLHQGTPPVDRS